MKFVIGSISPAVTSIVAKACYIYGKNVQVSFTEPPEAGTYTILSVTGSSAINPDDLKLLVIDDAVQSGRCRFSVSDDGRSILLKVVPWPEAWNGGHAETAAMQAAFERWVEEYGVTKFDANAMTRLNVEVPE